MKKNIARIILVALMIAVCFALGYTTGATKPAEIIEVDRWRVVDVPVSFPIVVLAEEPEEPEKPEGVVFKATHYCICEKCCGKKPDHPAYGLTASGRRAEPGVTVAVDPKVIPLGSTVHVDFGDGVDHVFRADDTGGAIKGNRLDICMGSHQEALNGGVKEVKVWWE